MPKITGCLLILSVAVALGALFYYKETITLQSVIIEVNNHVNIVIGVMSAQHHFDARQSIRDSWKTLTHDRNVSLYFLVGDTFCSIPPPDRVSPYSCEELCRPVAITETRQLSTSAIGQPALKPACAGFRFITHHALVVTSFNILNCFVVKHNPVKVRLIDSATRETIASVTFTWHIDDSKLAVLSKGIEPLVLPKDFEGQVLIDTRKPLPSHCICPTHWNTCTGVLSFLRILSAHQQTPVAFSLDWCSPADMVFNIHDVDEWQQLVLSRTQRKTQWDENTMQFKERLEHESSKNKDILFLNVTDVYRNLPKKLLLFFKWLYSEKKFSYLVKTDDDTFLNVPQIERELSRLRIPRGNAGVPYLWWWSVFREHWAVGSSGKWREDIYHSLTYPPFPCGAGYVLSYDVVRYLALNSGHLQMDFQGEDTALGVWLAGLRTVRHDAKLLTWTCDETCVSSSCSRAQLTVGGMYETWELYQRCGDMCNCTLEQ